MTYDEYVKAFNKHPDPKEKKMRAADAYAFGESIRELAGGVWPVSFRYLGLGTSAHVLCQCYLDTLA